MLTHLRVAGNDIHRGVAFLSVTLCITPNAAARDRNATRKIGLCVLRSHLVPHYSEGLRVSYHTIISRALLLQNSSE